jgi:uroporphyrinogen III methyltransferase/synthase
VSSRALAAIDAIDGHRVWLSGASAVDRHATTMRALVARGVGVDWVPAPSNDALARGRAIAAWLADTPLAGRRVFVTRAPHQADETAALLRERGATPVLVPTVGIDPPRDAAPFESAIDRLGDYDVVALTSANGVRALVDALARRRLDARALAGALIATIGPGTAKALEALGLRADVVADEHRGEALAAAIVATVATRTPRSGPRPRVLLPRAAVARNALPNALTAASIDVDVVEAYRARPPSSASIAPLVDAVATSSAAAKSDAILFTASSTLDNAIEALEAAGVANAAARLDALVVASIGPITSEAARRRSVRVDVESAPYTIPALIAALERHFAAR